jgi:hypothetical protein
LNNVQGLRVFARAFAFCPGDNFRGYKNADSGE